jgi:hypothetical protein
MGCVLGPDQRATTVCRAGANVKRNRREKKLGKHSRQADELPKSKRREEAEEKAEGPCAADSREFSASCNHARPLNRPLLWPQKNVAGRKMELMKTTSRHQTWFLQLVVFS